MWAFELAQAGSLRPFEVGGGDRQLANPFAGCREDRVAQRRDRWGQCGFAETRRGMVGDLEMHLDRRRLIDSQRQHRVEVGLHDAASIDRDRLAERCADAIECSTLRPGFRH